jgi:CheY-like chemotaxis protein
VWPGATCERAPNERRGASSRSAAEAVLLPAHQGDEHEFCTGGSAARADHRLEQRIREVLVRILRRCDIDADAAADGAEAVGLVDSRRYDLVILDLLMPGQHGFSVLTEITRRRPDQPVLVCRA